MKILTMLLAATVLFCGCRSLGDSEGATEQVMEFGAFAAAERAEAEQKGDAFFVAMQGGDFATGSEILYKEFKSYPNAEEIFAKQCQAFAACGELQNLTMVTDMNLSPRLTLVYKGTFLVDSSSDTGESDSVEYDRLFALTFLVVDNEVTLVEFFPMPLSLGGLKR